MLVAGGANLNVQDRRGYTPRKFALMAEDRELAAYLQSKFNLSRCFFVMLSHTHSYVHRCVNVVLCQA